MYAPRIEPSPRVDARIGIVAIGRNEGERLRRCLESLPLGAGGRVPVVYVDSGSTDGSRELARSKGVHVVELDLSTPFTAARARNAGFERLMQIAPDVELVQFVDGDCTLAPGWLEAGSALLRERPDVAAVCGRRRERAPDASVYNRLCDVEWDIPLGEIASTGGDVLMRASAMRESGGFDGAMIAGEEPDLCLRLRRRGHKIVRHEAEMSRHDAAMTRWTQWWKRALRTGHTTAELLAKYGPTPDHRRLRRGLSAILWSIFPFAWIALILLAAVILPRVETSTEAHATVILLCVLLPALYVLTFARIARHYVRLGRTRRDARAYALSCMLAKWPETWGMLLYAARRARGRRSRWIEYKAGPRGLESATPCPPR